MLRLQVKWFDCVNAPEIYRIPCSALAISRFTLRATLPGLASVGVICSLMSIGSVIYRFIHSKESAGASSLRLAIKKVQNRCKEGLHRVFRIGCVQQQGTRETASAMSNEEPRGRPRLNLKPRDEAAAAKATEERSKAAKSVMTASHHCWLFLCQFYQGAHSILQALELCLKMRFGC